MIFEITGSNADCPSNTILITRSEFMLSTVSFFGRISSRAIFDFGDMNTCFELMFSLWLRDGIGGEVQPESTEPFDSGAVRAALWRFTERTGGAEAPCGGRFKLAVAAVGVGNMGDEKRMELTLALCALPQKPVAVTTIVSTDMVDAVAEHYGVELRRVLTGFKFIGEQIGMLEAAGEEDRYIFGFEESYGYLSGTHVRDKDAVNASLLIMEAAAYYAQKGMNLGDAIDSLYETFGYYRNDLCSFTFEGVTGMQTMKNLMEGLRAEKPQTLAGRKVLSSVDYENDDTGLPKAQVLEYRLDGKAKLIVRPSGTEPKIKVYLSAVGKTKEEADSVIETMKRTANELMKA